METARQTCLVVLPLVSDFGYEAGLKPADGAAAPASAGRVWPWPQNSPLAKAMLGEPNSLNEGICLK